MTDVLAAYAQADAILRSRLDVYCRRLVRIQDRAGRNIAFEWNDAQKILHQHLERQREARGYVRALILKARQMGCSTYISARGYHYTTMWPGRHAYILTHEDRSTQQLFHVVKRIHDHMALDYRLPTRAANAHELAFAGVDSSYRVGTARNTHGTGRGLTLQFFHGSEVAYWSSAAEHFAAAMQAVPAMPNTEIILESTAAGIGGVFYDQWVLAESGQSDFVAVFLPWTIEPSYQRDPDRDWEPSAEEEEYQRIYSLSDAQLYWASRKNIELGGEPGTICPRFRQEYPAAAAEAFQTADQDSFIPAPAILRARKITLPDQPYLPRVLGVDIARGGADRTRIVDRQGRRAGQINEVMHTDDLMQVAHRVMLLLRQHPDIRRAYIDVTGLGAGVYDICRANGFGLRVAAVNFGSSAQDSRRFANRRAEMLSRIKDWLLDPGGADIPDDDEAHRHLSAARAKYDASSRLLIEPKEQISKRVGFSPDWADALALTFAELMAVDEPDLRPQWLRAELERPRASDFMTA